MMGINTNIPFSLQDNYHLWTIKDAKDGDVLAYVTDEEDLWIMIYWSLYEPYEGHVHYHALLVNDNFSGKGTCCICIDNLKPATKEQHDLLFAKMKEAGYVWDAEKKELKKIEDEPENFKQQVMSEITDLTKDYIRQKPTDEEIKELLRTEYEKGKYDAIAEMQNEQKTWSEEDERMYRGLHNLIYATPYCDSRKELSDWLESLKEKIKG